jgi:hypothetical protein
VRDVSRRALLLPLCLLVAGLSGCGFVGASQVSHQKPAAFVLRGHVVVQLTGSTTADGSTCTVTVTGVAAGVPVQVSDGTGKHLTTGELGPGVVSHTGTTANCEFPFLIPQVADSTSYDVAIGDRQPQSFPAKDLREGQEAVLEISS